MKFLKVLSNSSISGLFFSSLLALLVFDLNINVPAKLPAWGSMTLFLMISYGLLTALICLLLFFVFHFFSGKENKTGWISFSFLTMSFSVLVLLYLIIFKENYNYFLSFFEPRVQFLLKTQMAALFIFSIAGFFAHYLHRRHKKRQLLRWGYFVLSSVLLAFLFLQRTNYPLVGMSEKLAYFETKKIQKKIFILGLEGLSFHFLIPLSSEGKLPNFTQLMEWGSWGRIKSLTPSDSFVLKSSFNTGKLPAKHRQISSIQYQAAAVRQRIEIVPRFILFRQLTRIGLLKILPQENPQTPVDIWKILANNQTPILIKDGKVGPEDLPSSQRTIKLFSLLFQDLQLETSPIFLAVKTAFLRDCEYEEKAIQEKNILQPQLFYLHLNGLNTAESLFYRYNFPDSFGTIEQEEIDRYRPVIEKYYQFYDQIIGKYLAALKEDELFVAYSPYGIDPLPVWKRYVEWLLGNADVSASHEGAPDGAIFFYGKGIQRGKNIEGMTLMDVTPTLLYYLGLPVGKDMDGIVQSSLFTNEFTAENPVFYISSYEEEKRKNSK
ncbi:MAG: hypothetical protein WCC06_12210 [Candidatus Aminicenantales bacterium]